ncbi:MAG: NTP transferase domain-containing protein [Velocimicrobium sp.]
MRVNGIILAAGMSKRMGEFKPLLQINKKTMIEQSIDCMLESGVETITLVLGFQGKKIEEVLEKGSNKKHQIVTVYNEAYATTQMLDSVKIGVRNLKECDAFYLLPGDMPAIHPNTFLKVQEEMKKQKARIVFPTVEGYRKHPPLIASECIMDILNFESDGGLRELWKTFKYKIVEVPVDDFGCTLDADTKAQYQSICQYMNHSWSCQTS